MIEELHNQPIETENSVTRPRLTWLDYLLWALFVAGCLWAVTQLDRMQPETGPGKLVVVTKFVCQPTPTIVGSVYPPYYKTIP